MASDLFYIYLFINEEQFEQYMREHLDRLSRVGPQTRSSPVWPAEVIVTSLICSSRSFYFQTLEKCFFIAATILYYLNINKAKFL